MDADCLSLAALAEDIRACRVCRDAPRYRPSLQHEPRPVFQVSSSARICIAGQAPGVRVHASGRPYTDPSGVRLRNWLSIGEDIFYDARIVSVVAMGLCFPGLDAKGGDLPPRRECAELWRKRMFAALPNLELILLVGQYAQKWHLGSKIVGETLTETVARWRDVYRLTDHPRLMPMPHPSWRNNAWLTRNPWFETELLPVLRADIARIVAQPILRSRSRIGRRDWESRPG
jgi:uracil-DNA glycosylase